MQGPSSPCGRKLERGPQFGLRVAQERLGRHAIPIAYALGLWAS
jgi:hypothetical protein